MTPRNQKPLDLSQIGTYVAIGDSFSEGMCDPYPNGEYRGWTDRLAGKLSYLRVEAGLCKLKYANLAIRGRLIKPILAEQFGAALEMKPDLLSLVGGGNDLLRPGSDPDTVADGLEKAVRIATQRGIKVLLATSSNSRDGGLIAKTRGPNGILNSYIWSIASRYGCAVLDLWGMQALRTWPAWAPDRIHLTPAGHELVARAALDALGLPIVTVGDRENWGGVDLPTEGAPWEIVPAGWQEVNKSLSDNVEWARNDFWPWIVRHAKGRSSGDGRTPKWPSLTSVPAEGLSEPLQTSWAESSHDFNELAKVWDQADHRQRRAEQVAQAMKDSLPAGGSIWEFGAGTGLLGFNLLPHGNELVLTDAAAGMCEQAKAKAEQHPQGSKVRVEQLSLGTEADDAGVAKFAGQADRVVSLLAMHHLDSIPTLLRQVNTLLAPGGYLALSDLDEEDGSYHAPKQVPHNGFNRDQLTEDLQAAGFGEIKFQTVYEHEKRGRLYTMFLVTAKKL
ncbi:hypothetical protein BK816_06860 [Boudabousia tangfeifanii]|uniref:Methyltransferase domain-containing protein n=1 Tax=Boudabousia tangfeifanii TaxID=1912795 RepID=A0A1D9MKZ2_9ACTO|nr:GDSL-type esterase/lipase family protein [Boudabousia tangfeifanii]AOZ73041.1 hypothetical protein BK816_06860 [Boudabousia tangfeifanii]